MESSVCDTNKPDAQRTVIEESTKKKEASAYLSPAIEENGQDVGGVARVLSAVVCQ